MLPKLRVTVKAVCTSNYKSDRHGNYDAASAPISRTYRGSSLPAAR